MKIVDWFKTAAGYAEQDLDKLATQQQDSLAGERALAKIERQFEQFASDGVIDPKEMDQLRASMKAQGLDTSRIDQLWMSLSTKDGVSLDKGSQLGDLLKSTIEDARLDRKDSAANLDYQVQVATSNYTHSEDAASRLMKNEHDAYMVVIKNLVC